ncbi:MAG: DegT/DnrJ/EryC1/StrS family aminotransferase [Cytophagia bacterium]|nr:DegT/DnrJ/EryC1/StrS family aminotransferase [Cytophagia bacterium]
MPESIPFLSLQHQHEPIEEALQAAMQRVLKSNWFILGKELDHFERVYASFSNTQYCVGVANGLDALILSLRVLGVKEGDEIIVPANTFIATVLAVTAVGAKPIMVEPRSDTYCIDETRIEEEITHRTKVIIPVHLYGRPCNMNAIMKIAQKYELKVVEDNAQAHGAIHRNKMTGSFGHCNATSFYPGKNLGALGDAGAITTDDKTLYERLLKLRNYGSTIKYYHDVTGVNSRLDELQAALLSVKLKYLPQWTEQRKHLAKLYIEKLQGVGDLILPKSDPEYTHVFHLFVVRTFFRNELQDYLNNFGIQTLVHYPLPPHLQQAYAHLGFKKGDFPITEELAQTSLSLPFWPGMDEEMLDTVSDRIKRFYDGK